MNNVEPPHDDGESQVVHHDRGQWISGPALSEDDVRLAELREAHPGWTIWWGKHTQSWWAAPPPGLAYSLLNDTSLDSLEATILDVESWSGG